MRRTINSEFPWKKMRYAIAVDRNPIAFKKLFFTYHAELHLFGFSILNSRDVVEDIISDIFLKIWLMEGKILEID